MKTAAAAGSVTRESAADAPQLEIAVVTARPALPALTSLRFFAAAQVVVFHYAPPVETDFARGLTQAGYYAVMFFFLLSGFILTYVYAEPGARSAINVTKREFWKARFARIAPAYFLGLLLLLPRFLYTGLVSKVLPLDLFFAALVLVPLLQQAWWPPVAGGWNTPAWSLSVEFFFYAVFPFFALATRRWSPRGCLVGSYALIAIVALLQAYFLPLAPAESAWHNFKWFFPLWHLPLFLFGMALGRLYLAAPAISTKRYDVLFWSGALFLVLLFGLRGELPLWTQTGPVLAMPFALVIFGAARAPSTARLLTLPALLLLGEASYSMYILHIPLAFWWHVLTQKVLSMNLPGMIDFALYFLLVVGGSVVSFLYVEKPLRRKILGHREHRPA